MTDRRRKRGTVAFCLFLTLLGMGLVRDSSFCQPADPQWETRAADGARARSQFDSSIVHFQRAARMFEESGSRASYYACLNGIADNLIRKADFFRAESLLCSVESNGSKELGTDNIVMAATYALLGYIRTCQDRYGEAVTYYSRSLAIRQELLGSQDQQVAASQFGLGTAYYRIGNYGMAEACFEIAEDLQQKANSSGNVDLATTVVMLGAVHASKNQYIKSISDYIRALSILSSLALDTSFIAGNAHQYMAFSYKESGDIVRAAEHENRAMDIYRAIFGENHVAVSSCMGQLGDYLALMGDYDAALQYYQRASLIIRSLLGPDHSSSFEILRKMANLYAATRDTGRALELALRVVDGESKAFGPQHPEMASVYSDIAGIYRVNRDWKSARGYYAKALGIRQNVQGTQNALGIAGIFESIGETLLQEGKLDSAASILNHSFRVQDSSEVSNALLRSSTLRTLGEVERKRSHYKSAIEYFQKSLSSLGETSIDSFAAPNANIFDCSKDRATVQILAVKARTLEELSVASRNDPTPLRQALTAYEQASQALDRLRTRYRSEASKLFLQGEVLPIYQAGLDLSYSLYRTTGDREHLEQAFAFAERTRAAVLHERIHSAHASHFAGIPDSLRQEEERLSKNVVALSTRLELCEEHNDTSGTLKIRNLLFEANEASSRFQNGLERAFPAYFALRYGSESFSMLAIQAALDSGTCLVEYAFARDKLVIFAIGRDFVRLTSVPAGSKLDDMAQSFMRSVKTMEGEEYIKVARQLYDVLIAPVAGVIRGKKHLLIVPDGILNEMPFEALLGPLKHAPKQNRMGPVFSGLPYLLVSHEISYALSANLFVEALAKRSAGHERAGSFAGFAPVFRDSTTQKIPASFAAVTKQDGLALRSITVDNQKYNELKFSEDEVRSILGGFSRRNIEGVGFFHSLATEGNFKANAGNYSIVHIATHGYMNNAHPDLTALLFAPDTGGRSTEDGVFYAGEAYNMELNADLVVLSSCESGTGKLEKGEGVMTMARGFFYAGARNLIYSLWKVSDRHASLLMKAFYRELMKGETLTGALRKAKLEMVNNEATAFPLKWGGFVLMGRGNFVVGSPHQELSHVK